MEWIANMEGPTFLALYAAVILSTLLLAYSFIRSSPAGDKVDPMVPAHPNPYEMAYLRGGDREIAKLVLIELAKRGYIKEKGDSTSKGGKAYLRKLAGHPAVHELSAPHRAILDLVKEDEPVGQLIGNPELLAAVEDLKGEFLPRLQGEGMLVESSKRAKVLLGSAIVVIGLGGYKLAVALGKGKFNVGFLILFCVVAMFALWVVVSPRLTGRGRKYFRATQEAYRPATSDVVLDSSAAVSNDMLLHVGLFGAPILFGTGASAYATMLGLDPARRYGDSGCGSGCGGSSGGGDGCGGGCGGCGGD